MPLKNNTNPLSVFESILNARVGRSLDGDEHEVIVTDVVRLQEIAILEGLADSLNATCAALCGGEAEERVTPATAAIPRQSRVGNVVRLFGSSSVRSVSVVTLLVCGVFLASKAWVSNIVAADIVDSKYLIRETPDNADAILDALDRLSSHSGLLINSDVYRRRQLLIAECCTAMAKFTLFKGSNALTHFNPVSSLEMEYANRAIAAIKTIEDTSPEVGFALGDAYLTRAMVWHRFGETSDRNAELDTDVGMSNRPPGDRRSFFGNCIEDALVSLRHLPNSQINQRIHAYTLVGRSIHKSGSISRLSGDDLKQLVPANTKSHSASAETKSSSSNPKETNNIRLEPHAVALAALALGRELVPSGPADTQTRLCVARLRNAIGLVTITEATDQARNAAIESYLAGIEVMKAGTETDTGDFECGLMFGTLFGNLAEAYRLKGDLENEVAASRNAVRIFCSIQASGGGDKLRTEFGLVVSRMAIAEYRGLVRGISSHDNVVTCLSILRLLSIDFKTTAGFELTPHEDWVVMAIAERFGFVGFAIQNRSSRQEDAFNTIRRVVSATGAARDPAFLIWASDLRDLFPDELEKMIPQ